MFHEKLCVLISMRYQEFHIVIVHSIADIDWNIFLIFNNETSFTVKAKYVTNVIENDLTPSVVQRPGAFDVDLSNLLTQCMQHIDF